MAKKKNKTKIEKIKQTMWIKHRVFPLYIIFAILLVTMGYSYYRYLDGKVEITEGLSSENMEKIELEKEILGMVEGYPIEQMVPFIVEKDQIVAAFIVSIAKKESNWGKKAPVYQGKDCYNYWGYRGPNRVGSGGHSCFNNPKEAVDIISKRIETLVFKNGLNTPEKMIVWKCGSSCTTHNKYGVRKWISDVNLYFDKLTTTFF
ncbi:MAG: hypothetical protein U9O20_02835 [Patescibacteria group bacterium]|nr:hypothetical protein [Patescibacteria group bacterium]